MNYKDIIAQARRMGFNPYADVNGLQVAPYMEMTGQTEQDPGTSQQMGYTVSTPLGGTRYRTDVVDMDGNVLRSNVHDAGSDKYGLQDMAKLALTAVGANGIGAALGQPSVFGAGGLLGSGTAPALTGVDAAMADLAAAGGLTPASMGAAAGAAGAGTLAGSSLLKYGLPAAGALLSAAGGPSSSSPGGYVDSGYRPTISREGWNPAPQARQMAAQPTGLLMSPGKGEANSGLWRYAGLLDGAAGPTAPQMTPAMTPPMTPAMTPPRVTPPPMRATPPTTVRPAVAPASASAPTTAAARAGSTGAAYELPSWAFKELGPTEKAALYNSFRSRGFNDDYIRTIVNRTQPQPDSDWSALTQLARQLPQGLIAGDQVPTKATIQQAVAGWRAQQPATTQSSAQPTAPAAVQPAVTAADAPIGVPYISPAQRLKNYVYEGGANDDEATRRGLGYARLMGWSPDEAVRNWNDALGTKVTTDDYQRALQAYGFTSGGLLGG